MVSDPSTNRLFVGALGANSVVVLDERSITATNGAVSSAAVIATVKNITVPFGMGVLNSKVYVAENGSDSVGVIDAQDPTKPAETINIANGTNCRSASETHGPSHLAVNPVTNRIYVTLHDGTSQVAIVDADSRAVNCIDANAGAFSVAANSKSNHFYVGDRDAFDLRVYYDPQKNQVPVFQTTIPVMAWTDPYAQDSPRVPASPFYMAVSPDGTQLYVAVATNCKNRATPQHNCDLVDQILVYGIDGQGELSATPKIQLPIGGNTYDGGWILQSVCAPNRLYVAETNDGPDAAIRGVTTFNGDLQPDQVSAPALESTDGGEPFSLAENSGLGRIYAGYKYYNDNSKGRLSFVSETACR